MGHWTEIPAVPTVAFKQFDLTCLSPAERTAVFHSSGTTGQMPGSHHHGAESLALYEASLLAWFQRRVLTARSGPGSNSAATPVVRDFVILTPPPAQAPHSSLVHMFAAVGQAFAGAGAVTFCGYVDAEQGWRVDPGRLESAIGSGRPLIVLGTAFNYVHLLEHGMSERIHFAAPHGSRALETGGYKGRSRSLPKAELHGLISERLGVVPDQIICEYGMSELGSQAYDTPLETPARTAPDAARPFHFPPWSRVRIVSPETGLEVRDGEMGLIRVWDLANVWSVLAVQTEDLGIRRGDGFELVGRVAQADPKGCSLMTMDEVSRGGHADGS